jgi:hypothetical protein
MTDINVENMSLAMPTSLFNPMDFMMDLHDSLDVGI